jgi:hypothetical protein
MHLRGAREQVGEEDGIRNGREQARREDALFLGHHAGR